MDWQVHGFAQEKTFFERMFQKDALAHAYLFVGLEMIGKKTFALELAQKVNASSGLDPDRLLIGADVGSITIDAIRELKAFLALSPYASPRKIAIVDNAHLMTVEAQNALLKILEEPSATSHIFLITHLPDRLLETIHSRCQAISFRPHPVAVLAQLLLASDFSAEQKKFLVAFAHGRTGLLQSLVEQQSLPVIKADLQQMEGFIKAPLHERILMAQKLAEEEPTRIQAKVLSWLLYLHMHTSAKNGPLLRNLSNLYTMLVQPQTNYRLAFEQSALTL